MDRDENRQEWFTVDEARHMTMAQIDQSAVYMLRGAIADLYGYMADHGESAAVWAQIDLIQGELALRCSDDRADVDCP